MKKLIVICILLYSSISIAGDLIQFQSGESATANDVNANFAELESRIESSSISIRTTTHGFPSNEESKWFSQVAIAVCDGFEEQVIGGFTTCSHDDMDTNNTNLGFIYRQSASSRTFAGSCVAEFDAFYDIGPAVTVTAFCISGGAVNTKKRTKSKADDLQHVELMKEQIRHEQLKREAQLLTQ